jgi:hypothetical protein
MRAIRSLSLLGILILPLPIFATVYYLSYLPQPPTYAFLLALAALVLASLLLLPAALILPKRNSFRLAPVATFLLLLPTLGGVAAFGVDVLRAWLPHGSWRPTPPPEAIASFTGETYAYFGMGAALARARSGNLYVIQCPEFLDCTWFTDRGFHDRLDSSSPIPCPTSEVKPRFLPPRLPSRPISTGILRMCHHASTFYVYLAALDDGTVLTWTYPRSSASFWARFDLTLLGSIAGLLGALWFLLPRNRTRWRAT